MATTAGRTWVVSQRYDLAWFFGGAAASLAVLGLYLLGVPIVVLWWAWILGFDGPHIAAAFTRTYLDREEWRRRRGLLLTSLLAFVAGPSFLVAGWALRSPEPFQLFLGLAVFYAYYHVVRQHYGFLALYRGVARDDDAREARVDRWALYAGCWAPYAYFLVTHPKARVLLRLPARAAEGSFDSLIAPALAVTWALALATPLVSRASRHRGLWTPAAAYLMVTNLLHGLVYFVVARAEPVYAPSAGPDQDFLLISILVTMFHNVQYLGLVWFHNHNRYAASPEAGTAFRLSRSPALYLLACLVFSLVVYLGSACATGVFPGCALFGAATLGPFTASQVGLCLWWGLALQHYYLDQKIWRVRGDPALRRSLGLA